MINNNRMYQLYKAMKPRVSTKEFIVAIHDFSDEIRRECTKKITKAMDEAGEDPLGWPKVTVEILEAVIMGKEAG